MNRGMTFAAGLLVGMLAVLIFQPIFTTSTVTTVFSPEDGHEIIDLINSAQESIDIEVYVFSSRDVVDALERAKLRGVNIRIIIERNVVGGENNEIYQELSSKGFDVRYASSFYKLTHAKFIIVDGKKVLVGSHNLSNSALYKNREASVILLDPITIKNFERVFENDWDLAAF
jgi:phosphatidylserine/phosphatidylglycerophosphate/cardiolipin synthase-like enzyme